MARPPLAAPLALVLLLALVALVALAAALAAQEPPRAGAQAGGAPKHVQVPGTQVLLAPPPGFTPARRFSGFESAETGASIMVSELPGPFAELAKGMDAAGFRRVRVELLDRAEVEIAGRKGLLLRGSQEAHGATWRKWIGVFGDDTRAVQVVATCLEGSGEFDALRACVLGVLWDRTLPVDPFAHLTFTVAVPPELKFFGRMQNMLAFTRTGEPVEDAPDEPLLIIGPSFAGPTVADLQAAAKQFLRQIQQLREVQTETSRGLEVAGLPGWEVVARAKHSKTATPLVAYLVLLQDGEGFHYILGMAGEGARGTWLPVFERAARGFTLKPAAPDEGEAPPDK
jgi:hypothetical protein